jgi:hypothetical protein
MTKGQGVALKCFTPDGVRLAPGNRGIFGPRRVSALIVVYRAAPNA